jgi:hypothetical protein
MIPIKKIKDAMLNMCFFIALIIEKLAVVCVTLLFVGEDT